MSRVVSRRGYLNVSVPLDLTDWLTDLSEQTGLPRAQLVRFILEMAERDPSLVQRALMERVPPRGGGNL